jgi:hypothetical protein
VYVTWWVIQLYMVTLMQESFHHAAALVFAGIFVHLFRDEHTIPRKMIIPAILFTLFMGMMRLSWMLLCVPLFLGLIPRWKIRWIIGALVAAGLVTGVVYFVSGWLAAPGGNSITKIVNEIMTEPGQGLTHLIQSMGANFQEIIVSLEAVSKDVKFRLPGIQFIQILFLLAAAFYYLILDRVAKRSKYTAYWLFVIYSLLSIVVLSCAVYLPSGFLRVFSLSLFLCVCLLIALQHYRLVLVIVMLNIVGAPSFESQFRDHQISFQFTSDEVRQWRTEAQSVLTYQKAAPTPWCNTILIDLILYDYHVSVLPPEFGIGFYRVFPNPVKSRYYYASKSVNPAEMPFLEERTAFSFGGILYENTEVRDQCLAPTS